MGVVLTTTLGGARAIEAKTKDLESASEKQPTVYGVDDTEWSVRWFSDVTFAVDYAREQVGGGEEVKAETQGKLEAKIEAMTSQLANVASLSKDTDARVKEMATAQIAKKPSSEWPRKDRATWSERY